jgi:membrane-associated phospholipid phosphatase
MPYLKAHAPFFIVCLVYAVLGALLTKSNAQLIFFSRFPIYAALTAAFIVSALLLRAFSTLLKMIFFVRPERPLKYWINDIRDFISFKTRLLNALPLFLGFYLFMGGWSAIKASITDFNPFKYDEALYQIDMFLHSQKLPHEFIFEHFGNPFWIAILNYNYHIWFFALFGSVFYCCFRYKNPYNLIRFLIATIFLWFFAGNLVAMIFSSAGPCYFEHLNLNYNPYAWLMNQLNQINDSHYKLLAIEVQRDLWEEYLQGKSWVRGGVSAFPSLHVANSFLMVFVAFSLKLWFRWFALFWASLILVGSVALGWHYAIDGYAGVILASLAWKISKPITDWYVNRESFKAIN